MDDLAPGRRRRLPRAHQFSQALRGPEASKHNGHVISVFSPKGGVGKTTVAVNLALALTDNGARQVCLVDFDLAFGDVAITLQLFPSHTIEHAIGSEEDLDVADAQLAADPLPGLPEGAGGAEPPRRPRADHAAADLEGAAHAAHHVRLRRGRHRAGVRRADAHGARRDRRVHHRGDPRRPDPEERQGRPRHPRDAQHRPRPPLPAAQPRRRRGRHRRRQGRDDPRHERRVADLDVDRHRGRHQRRHADHRGQPATTRRARRSATSRPCSPASRQGAADRRTAAATADSDNDRFAKLFRIKR